MYTIMKSRQTADSIEPALKIIFEQVFQVSKLCDDDSIETIPLWDSMGHMVLMTAVEQKFNIRIGPEDIINLTTVKDIREYLRERL